MTKTFLHTCMTVVLMMVILSSQNTVAQTTDMVISKKEDFKVIEPNEVMKQFIKTLVLKNVILLVRWCNLEHIKLSHHIDVSR